MKRILVLTSLSLVAVFAITSLAGGQTVPVRGTLESITASTTPKRDRTRPYTFTTRGRIVPPPRFCAAGARPGTGAANCIPINCPAGTTNAAYCIPPTVAQVCSGKVAVRFRKGRTTVSSRTVNLRSNCTYRSRVPLRIRIFTRRGTLSVRARFQGNSLLSPKVSATRRVRAG